MLSQPRINRRKMHRNNIPASTAEEYYRVTLYNEFISHTATKLQVRFLDIFSHASLAKQVLQQWSSRSGARCAHTGSWVLPVWYAPWCGVPSRVQDVGKEVAAVWSSKCPKEKNWSSEGLRSHTISKPVCASPAHAHNSNNFTWVWRSFSQLKLIKTPRHSTTSADQLGGLAMMKIKRNCCKKIHWHLSCRRFQQLHPRRMKLLFILPDKL